MNFTIMGLAFGNWLLLNNLNPDAIALYHALLFMNNKMTVNVNGEWYWKVEFKVPGATLRQLSGGISETQLDRMRNQLKQAGLIDYRKGRGNQSGTYSLIPFDLEFEAVSISVPHIGGQNVCQYAGQPECKVWAKSNSFIININNNTNANFDDDGDDARARENAKSLFERYLGEPRAPEPNLEQCVRWINSMDGDLVEEAFREACKQEKTSFAYVEGIIRKMRQRGIKDMGDLAKWDIEHGRV